MTMAFIPARGGSKGLPRKNVRMFLSEPLVCRAVRIANEADIFDRIIVNTDDDEIGRLAADAGAEVVYRPAEMGSDAAEVDPLIKWTMNELGLPSTSEEVIALLYCTAPLRSSSDITKTVNLVKSGEYDSALTLVETSDYLWRRSGDVFEPTNYDPAKRAARQQESWNQYKENKAVYAFRLKDIVATGCRLNGKIGGVMMGADMSIDIDTLEEFKIAEAIAVTTLDV
jgi:CMP-N-acetylneuraminic acid synthetase